MALIDIYRNAPQSILREGLAGYDQGMQANDLRRQRQQQAEQQKQAEQQRIREQSFQQNLNGLLGSYGEFAHTPEGQRGLFADMAKAGFGREMMGLMGGLPQQAKPQQPEYQFKEFGDQAVTFNPATGEARQVPGMTKPAKPETPKKYEMVKNRKGIFEAIDPTTGLNKQGQPVEAWIDPKEPKEPKGPKAPDMRGIFEMEQKLAKDFTTKAEKSIGVATAYNKIDSAIKQNNPLDAYNAIVQFVKIIDPGTAAREGEVSSAVLASAGGAGNRLIQAARNAYNGTLDPGTAANIVASAKALMTSEKKTFDAYRAETKHKIKSYNARGYDLDEGAILGDYEKLFSGGEPAPAQKFTKPEEEDEYQAWKKAQGIR